MRFGYRIRSRVLRYAWSRWRDQITPAGKIMVGGVCLSAIGAVSVQFPIYQIFCALCIVLALAEIVAVLFMPRVKVDGGFADKAIAGERITGQFTVTNECFRPAFDLSLGLFGLPDGLKQVELDRTVPYLGPGESTTIPVTLLPLRRGLYELPSLRAFTTFPFNLVRSGLRWFPCNPLLVLPSFHPVEGINVPTWSRYQPGGMAMTSNIGESTEYIGNREYVPGESARRIDFRSWARLGKPVVREYHEEYFVRVALVVDTFVPRNERPGDWGFPRLEATISLAATIAEALSRTDHVLDVFAAGSDVHIFRSGRHVAHLENVLEILACLEPCSSNPFDLLMPALSDEFPSISTMICVLLTLDGSRLTLLRAACEAGCSVRAFVVSKDGDTENTLAAVSDMSPDVDITVYSVSDIQQGGIEYL